MYSLAYHLFSTCSWSWWNSHFISKCCEILPHFLWHFECNIHKQFPLWRHHKYDDEETFIAAESVEPAAVGYLSVWEWRPGAGEVLSVLEDWWQHGPHLVQHLLLQMDYTPHLWVSFFLDEHIVCLIVRDALDHINTVLNPSLNCTRFKKI